MITAHDLALFLGKISHDAPIKFSLNGKIYDGCGILIQSDRLSIFLKEEDDSFPAYQSHLFAGNSNESEILKSAGERYEIIEMKENDSPKSNLLGGGISFPIEND